VEGNVGHPVVDAELPQFRRHLAPMMGLVIEHLYDIQCTRKTASAPETRALDLYDFGEPSGIVLFGYDADPFVQ
jgi:hypothetical protein